MSTSQGQEHGVSEDQPIVRSPLPPILRTYLSPSSATSSEAGQSCRLRSPIIPVVRPPILRMYLSPSFGRSTDTRRRNTVASESAFSTGSRVISDYRSRLTSETIDGLICLQDWMRPSGAIDVTTIIEDLDNDDELLTSSPNFRVERNETQVEP